MSREDKLLSSLTNNGSGNNPVFLQGRIFHPNAMSYISSLCLQALMLAVARLCSLQQTSSHGAAPRSARGRGCSWPRPHPPLSPPAVLAVGLRLNPQLVMPQPQGWIMSRILVNCYIPECQLLLASWGKKFSA